MILQITEKEQKIFDMIMSCKPLNVLPRVAGGWVRDKIMGIDSTDMDIALENISGYDFACLMEKSFKDSMSSVNIIQSNPEKSKHLETAVCRINGLSIDFVNLRSEKYSESRIPIIEIGTPKEDAFRRDLTINSLFYNLVTKEVEDFTGRGIEDIKNKILRTPLDPYTTFSDDPLRICRLFRFKSKLNFSISDETLKSLDYADLKIQLKNKVSRERIYIEISKLITYFYGYKGIYAIVKYKYTESIFGLNVIKDNIDRYSDSLISKMNSENRWLYNLYLVLLVSSCKFVDDVKRKIFLNVKVVRDNLCCPNKIVNIIKEIEEGLYLCKKINLQDFSNYNIYFTCLILGDYYLDILFFMSLKEENEVAKIFYSYIFDNFRNVTFFKPKVEIKNLHEKLKIEKKFLNYFVQEIKIYQLTFPDEDIFLHLENNKEKIIKKFMNLEILYNEKSSV